MQLWARPQAIMTVQEQSMFSMQNPTSVSSKTVSLFPFAVVNFPVTVFSFETGPLFFHVFSLNTLTVAPGPTIHKLNNDSRLQ